MRPEQRRRVGGTISSGAPIIAAGLVVGGISVFAVQFLARRWLGDDGWGWFSVTWSLVYLAAPVITGAVEVAVISGAIDLTTWGSQAARRTGCAVGSAGALAVIALSWNIRPALVCELALIAVLGVITNIDARARLTTSGRFGGYAAITVAESIIRLLLAALAERLAPGDWRGLGVAIAVAPYVAVPMAWGIARPESLTSTRMSGRDALLIGMGSSGQVLVMNSAAIVAWMFDRSLAANQFTDLIVPKAIGFVVQPAQIVLLPRLVRDRTLDASSVTRVACAVVLAAGAVLSIGAAGFFAWGPDIFGGRTAPAAAATLVGGLGATAIGCAILVTQQDLAALQSARFATEWLIGSGGAVACSAACLALGINPVVSLALGGGCVLVTRAVFASLAKGARDDGGLQVVSVPAGAEPVESRET